MQVKALVCSYLHSSAVGGGGWRDYEGDELMVIGLYDFVLGNCLPCLQLELTKSVWDFL